MATKDTDIRAAALEAIDNTPAHRDDDPSAAGQNAIATAILYVGDELRAIRQSIEGVTRAGGVPLADVVAGAVDHATTEVANAARSIAQHGGGWQR